MIERPALHVVADAAPRAAKPETVAQRVRRLQAEAKSAAREQIDAMLSAMEAARVEALEVAIGGDAYPAGVRDLAKRFVDDVEGRMQTLAQIMAKAQ